MVQAAESFARVYLAEYQGLVRLAYVTTASQVIAEDIVQQVFTDVYERFGELREPAAYLRRAVLSRCTSWVRRRVVERRHTGLTVAEQVVAPLGADAAAVRTALARLRPRQRAAVFLRYNLDLPEGRPVVPTAVAIGHPTGRRPAHRFGAIGLFVGTGHGHPRSRRRRLRPLAHLVARDHGAGFRARAGYPGPQASATVPGVSQRGGAAALQGLPQHAAATSTRPWHRKRRPHHVHPDLGLPESRPAGATRPKITRSPRPDTRSHAHANHPNLKPKRHSRGRPWRYTWRSTIPPPMSCDESWSGSGAGILTWSP